MITLIACISRNSAIGKENRLLFSIKEDMDFFRTNTLNNKILMGSKTARSLPNAQPLKNRDNFVLCSYDDQSFFETKGFNTICGKSSVSDAISCILEGDTDEIIVIGGGIVYSEAISVADRLLITVVDEIVEDADAFFPEIDEKIWEISWQKQGTDKSLTFIEYLKK